MTSESLGRLGLRAGASGLALAGVVLAACGGSTEPTDEPSTEALVATLCDAKAAMECARPDEKASCLAELAVDQADATQEGCEAELRAYLKCVNEKPLYCGGIPEEPPSPHVSDSCGDLRDAFFTCYSRLPLDCGLGVGMGTCSLKCPKLSAACQGPDPNGPVECVCDTGTKVGVKFQATDCSKSLIWATGHYCQ